MDTPQPVIAWQPFTPRGVAAFAAAPLRRLLLVQSIIALLVGLAVAWFIYDAYFPVLARGVGQLPLQGEVRGQQLHWRGDSPVLLAENRFLALNVDLEHSRQIRTVAHVQIEFGRREVMVHSLLGYVVVAYPKGWVIAANREALLPLWGAWRPVILVGAILGVYLGLMLSWWLLALLYVIPVRLYSFYLDRSVGWRGAWRLSGAALAPGALLLVIVLSFYDLGIIDLVQFGFVYLGHFVVGWVYLGLSPLHLPGITKVVKPGGNPFARRPK